MTEDSIFISYSRVNSEFATNLAKTLHEIGANIWIDKLNIKIGENWDNAIQTALQESSTCIIILSKDSVASNHVMDEVGFAIQEHKNVIPLLIEECNIPFRLQRRQFVDFRGDYQMGIGKLIEALYSDSEANNGSTKIAIPIDFPEDNVAERIAEIRKKSILASNDRELRKLLFELKMLKDEDDSSIMYEINELERSIVNSVNYHEEAPANMKPDPKPTPMSAPNPEPNPRRGYFIYIFIVLIIAAIIYLIIMYQ
ncbi:MAG: toll/interleukin-1 receptor domain-containing protein [Flavobacteriaceae bacterium]|nr:toll/interleukin-1 receptor domain-containing protein [Flavobacteriaceae bacterium]